MPYLVARRRRVKRTNHLGQFTYPNEGKIYLTVSLVDSSGAPVQNQKFYFDILPDLTSHPELKGDPAMESHYSQTTDMRGQAEIETWSLDTSDGTYNNKILSITPLFDSAGAPVNKAIIWQYPIKFSMLHDASLSVKNIPGGGIANANVAPPPAPAQPPGASSTEVASGSFPWGPVIAGCAVFVVGLILIPKIMGGR